MSRPTDWTPLARDSDPVPGDPTEVEQAGRDYQEVAEAIETASRRLREIADDSAMQSKAVEELREQANDVADNIERAYERYDGVGDALVVYAGPLETAQEDSRNALNDAIAAQEDLEDAQRRRDDAQARLDNAGEDEDTSSIEAEVRRANDDIITAGSALSSAKKRCDDAEDDRDRAATNAIEAIREVEDSGDLNDGWWEDWGSKVVSAIAKVAGAIAAIAGVLALAVGWIPIIGQALAGVLGTIALVAGIVSLLANFTLAMTGDGSWSNVILDVISVASFGLGRAVVAGGRAAIAGTRGASRLAAGRIAAQGGGRIRSLTGADDIANLSRAQARSLASAGRNTPLFNLRAPFTDALSDIGSLPSQLRNLGNLDFSRAFSEIPSALRNVGNSRSWSEVASRLTGNTDQLRHLDVADGLDDALLGMSEVTEQLSKAMQSFQLGNLATGAGGIVDGYNFSNLFDGGSPVDNLNLPDMS